MLLYKYLNADYGLLAVKERRIKISRLAELNDPFEFLGCNLQDPAFRQAMKRTKRQFDENYGLLCFSRTWQNPIMWAHYADNHKGICLGFEMAHEELRRVNYVKERPPPPETLDESFMKRLLFSKFRHWKYEKEVRGYVILDKEEMEEGMFFFDFSDTFILREVIVGANSSIRRTDVDRALAGYPEPVNAKKARAAFGRFRVVSQRNGSLWP